MHSWGPWGQTVVDSISDPHSFALCLALANEMLANMTQAHAWNMLTQMAIITLVSLPFCYEKNILGCLIGLRRKMRETLNQAAPGRPGADRLARTRYGASPRHATPSRTADTSEMFIIVTGIYGVQGFLGEIIVPNKLKCQVLFSSVFLFGSISDGGISTGCPNVLGFFFRNFSWEYLLQVFIPLVPPQPLSFSSPFVP